MSNRFRVLLAIVPLFVAAALVACGDRAQIHQDSTSALAAAAQPSLVEANKLAAGAQNPAVEKNPARADSAPRTDVEPTLTIVYTNNIDGEIEPCG